MNTEEALGTPVPCDSWLLLASNYPGLSGGTLIPLFPISLGAELR